MELGQRLRQARLEAGLSQRQLCGEEITRNMLSLIENGTAKPSMDTLRYLAARLGKPMGYFLEEQVVTSPNQAVMDTARRAYTQGEYRACLETLADYQAPDGVFDPERWLLEALACIALAQQAQDQPDDHSGHSAEDQRNFFHIDLCGHHHHDGSLQLQIHVSRLCGQTGG